MLFRSEENLSLVGLEVVNVSIGLWVGAAVGWCWLAGTLAFELACAVVYSASGELKNQPAIFVSAARYHPAGSEVGKVTALNDSFFSPARGIASASDLC